MADKPVRLFVFDFDGTALGGHEPYEQFPKPFARFLDLLVANRIAWATNTTLAPERQLEIARNSGVRTDPALLVGQTGRQIATVRDGRVAPNISHERAVVAAERRFKQKNWPTVRRVLIKLLSEEMVDRVAYDYFGQNGIAFTCTPGNVERVYQELLPLTATGEYYFWDPSHAPSNTLLMKTMNKGEPIRLMQRRFGLEPEQIVVAGDETNDLPMFDPAVARWMVCPANAHDLVKQAVTRHDGVVAARDYSWGVIEAVQTLLTRLGRPLKGVS